MTTNTGFHTGTESTDKALGVEVEVFMRRVKLLFWSTLLQLSSTTGSKSWNLPKRLSSKVIKGVKHFKVIGGSLLCRNPLITDNSLCSDKQHNILICNE